jgi:DNA-binding transcriptional ArsR family regulator
MQIEDAAKCFGELGHVHRLEAYRLLVKASPGGLTVGEIQAHLGLPKSTFSHHLDRLAQANLITQQREGRTIRCFADCDRMAILVSFLADECCAGVTVSRSELEEA